MRRKTKLKSNSQTYPVQLSSFPEATLNTTTERNTFTGKRKAKVGRYVYPI
jgi:hypothetical protein